jgi:hypothetical protein
MVLLTKKIINYKPPIKARLVMQKRTMIDINNVKKVTLNIIS